MSYIKYFLIISIFIFPGCTTVSNAGSSFFESIGALFESGEDKEPKTGTEAIEDKSQDTLEWLAVASIISLVVTLALGFKFPMLHELTPLFGIGFVTCWALVWFIELLAIIKWVALIAAICYAGFRIYMLREKHRKEVAEHEEVNKELSLHFDDPEGEQKLSRKAHDVYTLGRPPRTLDESNNKD
jgi:hypothetical protein